jgi:hypothetical protein
VFKIAPDEIVLELPQMKVSLIKGKEDNQSAVSEMHCCYYPGPAANYCLELVK